MDEEELARLERLAGAATPGPWKAEVAERSYPDQAQVIDAPTKCSIIDTYNSGCASDPCPDEVFFSPENARFIAAARTALPALVAEVRRLQAENAKLEANLDLLCRPGRGTRTY